MGMAFKTFAITLSLLCGVLSGAANCASREMITIEKYVDENFKRDPQVPEFVYLRCSSVLGLLAAHFEKDPDFQEKSKAYHEAGQNFLMAALKLSGEKRVFDQIGKMMNAYQERLLAQTSKDNSTTDPVIRSDIEYCFKLEKTRQQKDGGRPTQ